MSNVQVIAKPDFGMSQPVALTVTSLPGSPSGVRTTCGDREVATVSLTRRSAMVVLV